MVLIVKNPQFLYEKRPGTSGIGGQLYETKLLSLLLFRAINHNDITKFNLGSNIKGIGAFDDIILKYKANGEEKPKVLFIQAKHKEQPDQNNITVQDFFKEQGDFCLHKYFDSYLKIRSKFNTNHNDDIFNNAFEEVDCDFIIYTSAIENIGERELVMKDDPATRDHLLQTSKMGKQFRLIYSDQEIDRLWNIVLDIRTQLLGKTLMKFLFKDNYKNMLVDELMKTYHVFLAQHVIQVISEAELNNPYLEGRFRDTFFTSKDLHLKILKETIYKEFSLKYSKFSSDQIEEIVQAFVFKLPFNFGNINFNVGGSSRKKYRRLMHICSKIKQLIDSARSSGSIVVKIDHSMVGPKMILQQKDLEIYRLGGLVGNLFVLDNETLKLKFNESIESLPPQVQKLYQLLKKEYPEKTDFNKYRFDINAYPFPKLMIRGYIYEWWLIKEFANNLIFYTNQAGENDVEKVLKTEITTFYKLNLYNDNLDFRLKGESIYLKVHDTVQKWWKEPNKSPYINEHCKYYDEANEQLYSNSLLKTLHSLYILKLNNYGIKYQHVFDQFERSFENDQKFLSLVTDNINLTSIKLIQYLQHNSKYASYIFVNLDFIVSEKCFDKVLTELKEVKLETVLITCENHILYDKILYIKDLLQGFVIAITKNSFLTNLNSVNYNQLCDNTNAFIDLSIESQRKILNETNITFQGYTVPLKTLLMNKFEIIDSIALCAILNNENIQIGRSFTSVKLDEFEDCFVKRTMCRFISLKTNEIDNLYIINNIDATDTTQAISENHHDVVVISDKVEDFINWADKLGDKNIHWFVMDNGNCVWEKTRGSLNVISKHVDKSSSQSPKKYNPITLFDIDEKVAILCAGPGMGKSSLMTYLSIQTKIQYPSYWILRINCLDYKNLLSDWQLNITVIDLKETIKFLYTVSLRYIKSADDFIVCIGPEGDVFIDTSRNQKLMGLAYLEVEVFNNLYNTGQIAIIFDGIDEISPDYLEQIINILEILRNSKVSRLWITTRPYNIIDSLEQRLGIFAFVLQKLSLKDQHELLVKLWGKTVGEKVNDRLLLYVTNFFKAISLILHDREQDFTSTPLHISMIAEIYQDFFKDYYDPFIPRLTNEYMKKIQDINSLTLYEKFVNIKFYNIRFGEKKPYIYDRDPDLKKMIEMERREFIKDHKKLGAYAVFNKTVQGLFSPQDMKEISNALARIKTGEERTGIIERIFEDEPHFVHFTFAEYFATDYLCDKLKTEECSKDVWIYLFDTIFVSDIGNIVRKFFDFKLSRDKDIFNLVENLKYKQDIFDMLVKQREVTSLSTVVMEFLERNALFLLQCIKDILTQNNLCNFINYVTQKTVICCTFCSIADRRLKKVMESVFEIVKCIDKAKLLKLFTCGDVPLFNALGIAITYSGRFPEDKEMLDVMLSSVDEIDTALEIFTMPSNMGLLSNTIVHVLIMNNNSIRLLLEHLLRFNKEQRMKIFNTFNADGKLAAHFAAKQGDIDFFAVLSIILEIDQFQKICTTYDNIGRTPFDYLLGSIHDANQFNLVKPLKDLYNETHNLKNTVQRV